MGNETLERAYLSGCSDEALRAFLRDSVDREISDREWDTVFLVVEELLRRRRARGEELDAKAALERFYKYYRE